MALLRPPLPARLSPPKQQNMLSMDDDGVFRGHQLPNVARCRSQVVSRSNVHKSMMAHPYFLHSCGRFSYLSPYGDTAIYRLHQQPLCDDCTSLKHDEMGQLGLAQPNDQASAAALQEECPINRDRVLHRIDSQNCHGKAVGLEAAVGLCQMVGAYGLRRMALPVAVTPVVRVARQYAALVGAGRSC